MFFFPRSGNFAIFPLVIPIDKFLYPFFFRRIIFQPSAANLQTFFVILRHIFPIHPILKVEHPFHHPSQRQEDGRILSQENLLVVIKPLHILPRCLGKNIHAGHFLETMVIL